MIDPSVPKAGASECGGGVVANGNDDDCILLSLLFTS
jgi:hypothetical protein